MSEADDMTTVKHNESLEGNGTMSEIAQARRIRPARSGFLPGIEGNPDALFDADGNVKLPKMTDFAISVAANPDNGWCFSRQPTRERAERVASAVRDRVEARGLVMEIRPGKASETFGIYLARPTS